MGVLMVGVESKLMVGVDGGGGEQIGDGGLMVEVMVEMESKCAVKTDIWRGHQSEIWRLLYHNKEKLQKRREGL